MSEEEKPKIFFYVKVPKGQERTLAIVLFRRAQFTGSRVRSILFLEQFRGFLVLEANSSRDVKELVSQVPKVKSVAEGAVAFHEIERYVIPEKPVIELNVGDIVVIMSGAFKGEKARVKSVSKARGEVTVSLLGYEKFDITLSMSKVRLEERAGEESGEESKG